MIKTYACTILGIIAAVLVVAPAAKAMPSPRAGTLVPPLVLVDERVGSVLWVLSPEQSRSPLPSAQSVTVHPPYGAALDLPPPDTTLKKIGGYTLLTLGTGLELLSILMAIRADASNPFSAMFLMVGELTVGQCGIAPSIVGVGLITYAHARDNAFDSMGGHGDELQFDAETYYKAAKYTGFTALALAAATGAVAWIGTTKYEETGGSAQKSRYQVAFVFSGMYLGEIGLATGIMSLAFWYVAHSKSKSEPTVSVSGVQPISLTLVPMNGGLGAGVGMRF